MLAQRIGSRTRSAWWFAQLSTIQLVFRAFYRERLGSITPLVVILLLMALILMVLTVVSPLAPFVYPLF